MRAATGRPRRRGWPSRTAPGRTARQACDRDRCRDRSTRMSGVKARLSMKADSWTGRHPAPSPPTRRRLQPAPSEIDVDAGIGHGWQRRPQQHREGEGGRADWHGSNVAMLSCRRKGGGHVTSSSVGMVELCRLARRAWPAVMALAGGRDPCRSATSWLMIQRISRPRIDAGDSLAISVARRR